MSDNPPTGRLAGIVARLHALHPRLIDLSLERLERLLARLDHPERRLPPVIHVAGTNGKGSTCAFLRAIGEAAGWRVHVYTSPHLVRFNERVRVAGEIVSDDALEAAFDEVERANAGEPITVFEVLTAAAFVLFARHPADLCVLEVGLGGRFDATNVVSWPAACAITSISMDHRELLGDTLGKIAFEKAGIIKRGVPVATGLQADEALAVIRARARDCAAPLLARGAAWDIAPEAGGLSYRDADGALALPRPGLAGLHQVDNAGIAVAALRAARLGVPEAAYGVGVAAASWPGRMQRLTGRLAALLPAGWELWVDGGHNPGGGVAMAEQLALWRDAPVHFIVGMKQSKDSREALRPILPVADTIWAVAEPGQHLALPVAEIVAATEGKAIPGPTVAEAMAQLPPAAFARVVIWGSLYLAGEVLKLDGTIPG